jgi:hypothetical protein
LLIEEILVPSRATALALRFQKLAPLHDARIRARYQLL